MGQRPAKKHGRRPELDFVQSGLTNTQVEVIVVDPITPTTLYVGPTGRGVFKSTDGGQNWNTTGLTNIVVYALAIDPKTPATLYAVADGNRIFRSTNGGDGWTRLIPVGLISL